MNKPIIFLITGLSGAGKTFLLKTLEDEGYYTVDNVPPHLIESFVEMICTSDVDKLAIVSDLRWKNSKQLKDAFYKIGNKLPCNMQLKKIFLEADTKSLIDRFRIPKATVPSINSPAILINSKEEGRTLPFIFKNSDNVFIAKGKLLLLILVNANKIMLPRL